MWATLCYSRATMMMGWEGLIDPGTRVCTHDGVPYLHSAGLELPQG